MPVVDEKEMELKIIKNKEDLKETILKYDFMLYMAVKGVEVKNIWDLTENPSWTENLSPWLDELIFQQEVVYPLIIKGRAGIVSRKDFPYFYRAKAARLDLNKAAAAEYYKDGVLSRESLKILEALESRAMSVSELRTVSDTCGKERKPAFDKAMMEIKQSFAIVKVDVISKGWGENVFALTHKVFADDMKKASKIELEDAYTYVLLKYLNLYGVVELKAFSRLFDFNLKDLEDTAEKLYQSGKVIYKKEGKKIMVQRSLT